MPGMMDSILNLGLNDLAAEGLATSTGDARLRARLVSPLIQMYGEVVAGVDGHRFEQALTDLKATRAASTRTSTSLRRSPRAVETYKGLYEEGTGEPFPQDASDQLRRAYRAVRFVELAGAQVYRRTYDIPDDLGTAVNVVQMVFGNRGEAPGPACASHATRRRARSGCTASSSSNAQGEDVVAGIRTPEPIEAMREKLPTAFDQLVETLERLEAHYRDLQDIEFTVEEGRLYLLQTRTGKRTAAAALRVAVEMVEEGLISRDEAVARIDPAQLDQLLHPMIDPNADVEVATRGLNASPERPRARSSSTPIPPKSAARRGRT